MGKLIFNTYFAKKKPTIIGITYNLKFFLKLPKNLGPAIKPTEVTKKLKPNLSISESVSEKSSFAQIPDAVNAMSKK